jgi:hypothetical protein
LSLEVSEGLKKEKALTQRATEKNLRKMGEFKISNSRAFQMVAAKWVYVFHES